MNRSSEAMESAERVREKAHPGGVAGSERQGAEAGMALGIRLGCLDPIHEVVGSQSRGGQHGK